ncbi:hypothetical protein L1049_017617 [Liquidambar formosana]|uniref:Uncharacterized protein n=1 Tax=Liquidambar formosana TaxID=63359 RepID=A0AAP0S8R7_LIQFO
MYLVGIFVLQTICAVWVLGSADSDQENGNLESESKSRVLELKGMNKGKSLLNGNGNGNIFPGKLGSKPGSFVFIDESELEAKIAEIRAMAREARESEKKEAKTNGLVSEFDDDVSGSSSSRVKSGIEKEVDARLVKLQKRLNSVWEKSPGSLPSYLNKFGKVEDDKDNLDAKEANGGLMFKKKHKFRSPSTKPRNDPKGFQGLEGNGSISKKEKSISETLDSMARSGSTSNGGLSSLDPKQQIDLRDGDLQESIFGILDEDKGRELPSKESKSLQNAGKNLDKKSGRVKIANAKPSMGVVQETSNGRPSVEAMKSRESTEVETKNSLSFTKENRDTTTKSDKPAMLSRNDSSKRREVGCKPLPNKFRDNQSEFKSDLWWLNLPYALAILLRRGSDNEGPGGLYTLKITSNAQDQSVSAYTVVFEDRGDANNFCYLLESFFEDLSDFSADIVPLSIKELHKAVKSHTMKLIVVKKGQLHLYAGQPLADVEMALRSLVEQNGSASQT